VIGLQTACFGRMICAFGGSILRQRFGNRLHALFTTIFPFRTINRKLKLNEDKVTGRRLLLPQIIDASCSILNNATPAGMAIFPKTDSATEFQHWCIGRNELCVAQN
jgi:hypothetical protein